MRVTRLLFLGLAGLDWPSFDALTASGALPVFAAARAKGRAGWLGGAPTTSGPAAWATFATGRLPEAHGVWRAEEAWAGGVRPITAQAWRAAPLWRRLAAAGVAAGAAAWPATRPGADAQTLVIDEDFLEPAGVSGETWPLPPACVPREARDVLAGRRVHPTDITADMLAGFAPGLASLDQSRDAGLPLLAIALARAASAQGAAAWMLEREAPPTALFVHQPWLGEVRDGFERQRTGVFAGVVPAAWRFLDGLFGGLVRAAGPQTTVIAASPGWRDRPGVVLAWGPGVEPGREALGVDALDLAPTVLAAFGLEDASLPGGVVEAIAPPAPRRPAPDPLPEPAVEPDRDLLRQAAEAGFPPPPGPSPKWRAQGLAELSVLLLPRSARSAADAAQAALALDPDNFLAWRICATAAFALEEAEPLLGAAQALSRLAPGRAMGELARAAAHVLAGERAEAAALLRRCEADPDPELLLLVAHAWRQLSRPRDAARALEAILEGDPDNVQAEIGLAMTEMSDRNYIAAEARLRRVLAADPGRAAVRLQLAWIFNRTGRPKEAQAMAAAARRLGASAEEAAAMLA